MFGKFFEIVKKRGMLKERLKKGVYIVYTPIKGIVEL